MRRLTVLLLALSLLVAPAALAAPAADEAPTGWWSDLVDWAISLVFAADEEEPRSDDNLGPFIDSETEAESEELPPPDGELGPWWDPYG